MNLTWDSDNKLRSADIDANGTADVNFQYDALGRRVARSGTGGSVVYVQMDQQTIADYPVGGAATTPTFRYVFASYIDEPVVRKGPTSTSTVHFYHRNQQYSVYALTDSSGNVSERYAYSAYGEPTVLNASGSVISSSAINNRYSYTGREWDATVGLYHFRARWMSGLTGRFLTRDPMKYKGSPWDLYEFVDSRALHLVDPLGLHGGGGYICCGGRWIHTHQFGCCNNVPFEKSKQCCENGQIVNKVPIWKTTFPVFQDPYLNNVSCGWNIVCPLSWVGWNLVHAVICLDGPTSGCIGVNDVTDRVENQDYMLQNAAPDPDDIVSTKHMVCPRERDRIRNSVGQPWNHGYIFGNCHHWSCANGVGVW
jgi:RHS repeat-associated protein